MTDASQPQHDIAIDKDVEITLRDGVRSAPYTHYCADYNTGQNTIYTGGTTPSHLLLPIIPIKTSTSLSNRSPIDD